MQQSIQHDLLTVWRKHADTLGERIETGIEKHRKADACITLCSGAAPLANTKVTIKQQSHSFHFGCNSFMYRGYESDKLNAAWDEQFCRIFNMAVVPFFWGSYEPEQGKLRYDSDSEPMWRRPPVDWVMDWCEERGLTPKGHNMFWPSNADLMPNWLPEDPEAWWPLIEKRFQQLSERYGSRIPMWDVVNEVFKSERHLKCPKGYVERCYQLANQLFPNAELLVNETTGHSWNWYMREYSPYVLFIERLLSQGCRVDKIGMQHHLFSMQQDIAGRVTEGANSLPHEMAVLDTYWDRFSKPIHISEVTVPGAGAYADPLNIQAELTRDFYRAWFSHPGVDAIVWWNFADGAAYNTEGMFEGGLMNPDLTAKPVYEALDELINHEWHTELTLTTDAEGKLSFCGFCGTYELKAGSETFTHCLDQTVQEPVTINLES